MFIIIHRYYLLTACSLYHHSPVAGRGIFIGGYSPEGLPSGVQRRSPVYGDSRNWSSLQTLFTDFDCRNDQNFKISHNSLWPVCCTCTVWAKRHFCEVKRHSYCLVTRQCLSRHGVLTYRQDCLLVNDKYTKHADTDRFSAKTTQKYDYLTRNG